MTSASGRVRANGDEEHIRKLRFDKVSLGQLRLIVHIGSYTARSSLLRHLSSSSSPRDVSVDVSIERETLSPPGSSRFR
jgi:hypothetical protein